jgi:hypothetical protein
MSALKELSTDFGERIERMLTAIGIRSIRSCNPLTGRYARASPLSAREVLAYESGCAPTLPPIINDGRDSVASGFVRGPGFA